MRTHEIWGKSGEEWGEIKAEGRGSKFDQNTLCGCVKLSIRKLKEIE